MIQKTGRIVNKENHQINSDFLRILPVFQLFLHKSFPQLGIFVKSVREFRENFILFDGAGFGEEKCTKDLYMNGKGRVCRKKVF
jgi:hypothetical protein